MSLNKRVKGDFLIESVHEDDSVLIKSQNIVIQGLDRFSDGLPAPADEINTVTIDGHLVVTGNTNTVTSTDTEISDNFIILNAGETGAGVSLVDAGFVVDRGSLLDTSLRFSEGTGWEATDDGTIWYPLDALGAGGFNLVNDTTPELGGDLDVNAFEISTDVVNGDVQITGNGTGSVLIDPSLKLRELTTELPLSISSGYSKLYASAPGAGGTGLYVTNDTTTDELVSQKKAMVFGLIF